ncbi:hypothetical protein KSP39_PZI008161 [Platanthera zijinensis]|uniref:MI domain-containing protein n=1 Tax=Platanthera zijinensis TaxID=2320716 RepID=A0AAP0G8J8_9ASPA
MDKKNMTRKERRKEGRLNKQNKKFTSWLGHQRSNTVKPKEKKVQFLSSKANLEGMSILKKTVRKSSSAENHVSTNKQNRGLEKRAKSKFHEYLKMELSEGVVGAEEDLKIERRLAKKLLKGRSLGGPDDGLNLFIEGTPSFDDFSNAKHDIDDDGLKIKRQKRKHKDSSIEDEGKNRKRRKSSKAHANGSDECYPTNKTTDVGEQHNASNIEGPLNETTDTTASAKYISPPSRAITTCESEEHVQFGLKVKRLLSKLVGSTVESTSGEVAKIFQSVTRSVGCEIVGEKIMAFCVCEEKGGEQGAAVFAAFIAGMACLVGVDFSAKILAYVARSFEDEYCKGNKLSLENLTSVFCHLYIFGVCDSYIVFDLLDTLSKRLTELDVSTILKILEWCGMKLRGDDPVSMKGFVVAIQSRVNVITSDTINSKRKPENIEDMESMLETVCDIKDNKKRSKEDPASFVRIKKWLQKLRSEDVLLRNLTWCKLLDPDKKGQWWLSGEVNSITDNFEEVATTIIDKEAQEVQKILKLAAAQGMNTDTRRAIFLIIMSAEDYLDAFEKILRLNLSGKQDREVMRVIIYCCMQERNFNKYYTFLASKFCSYNKNFKFTLQYCLWDHWKDIDSMESESSSKLASFIAEMLRTSSISLSALKSVNLMDPSQLTPSRIMHFRSLFETLFEKNDEAALWNMFTRVAASPDLESLRSSLIFFVKQYVVIENSGNPLMAQKFGIAKKALHNVAGILK